MTNDPENLTVEAVLAQSDQMIAVFGRIGAGLGQFAVNYAAALGDFDHHPTGEEVHELAKILLSAFSEGTFNGNVPHTVNNMTLPPGMM